MEVETVGVKVEKKRRGAPETIEVSSGEEATGKQAVVEAAANAAPNIEPQEMDLLTSTVEAEDWDL
jgi:hypothetical protein